MYENAQRILCFSISREKPISITLQFSVGDARLQRSANKKDGQTLKEGRLAILEAWKQLHI